MTKVTQSIKPTAALDLNQSGAGENTQAGNMMEATVTVSGLQKTVTAGIGATTLDQAGATGAKKQALQ